MRNVRSVCPAKCSGGYAGAQRAESENAIDKMPEDKKKKYGSGLKHCGYCACVYIEATGHIIGRYDSEWSFW